MVVASGGTVLSAIIAATAAGTGGATLGAILAKFLAKHHADYIQKQIDRGGLLLWVHIRSPDIAKKAEDILKRNTAHNVHIHKIPFDKG